jgi:hypothetical protein
MERKQSNKKIIPRNPAIALSGSNKGAGNHKRTNIKEPILNFSAELRGLFTQSANVASEMYQLKVLD